MLQKLNEMYAQTGAVFTLVRTTRTTRVDWYTADQNSPEWLAMTNALHQGGVQVRNRGLGGLGGTRNMSMLSSRCLVQLSHCFPDNAQMCISDGAQDLNLYSMSLPYPLLGWSQFPWWYATSPKQVRHSWTEMRVQFCAHGCRHTCSNKQQPCKRRLVPDREAALQRLTWRGLCLRSGWRVLRPGHDAWRQHCQLQSGLDCGARGRPLVRMFGNLAFKASRIVCRACAEHCTAAQIS